MHLLRLILDKQTYILDKHIHSHRVEAALGDDDIGILLRRLDKLLVHGLHRSGILLDDRLHGAPALADVTQDASCKAQVGIGIYKDLDIHQITKLLVLENQDAINDDDARGLDYYRIVRTVMLDERIYRVFDRHIALQCANMLHKHIGVKSRRV